MQPTLNFCQWWHFLWSSTLKKMISTENNSEENAIKTGYIAENVDIYVLAKIN